MIGIPKWMLQAHPNLNSSLIRNVIRILTKLLLTKQQTSKMFHCKRQLLECLALCFYALVRVSFGLL